MRRLQISWVVWMPFVAATALGKLYHPEFIHSRHGPGLIDCGSGFESALRHYFEDDAKKDGLAVQGTPTLTVADPEKRISRFTARLATETFEGFIYVDPTMTEAEAEPWEDDDADQKANGTTRVCSATFTDSHATADEKRQVDIGWNTVVSRLYLDKQVNFSAVR